MANKVSITFKAQISKALPEDIKKVVDRYNELGIYAINIPTNVKNDLESLLNSDMEWVKLILDSMAPHQSYFRESLFPLELWLINWRKAEEQSAGKNQSMIGDLIEKIKIARIRLLSIMIWRKPKGIQDVGLNDPTTMRNAQTVVENFTKALYDASNGSKLEVVILYGKRDYFRSHCWPSGKSSIPINDFFELFKDDFHLFLENGLINQIYIKEIKKHLNLDNDIRFMDLERIYNYFFGSFISFIKFLNRNYQYNLVEKGMENQGLTYDGLQNSVNTNLVDKDLIITNCPFPQLRGKEFKLSHRGLANSPRFCDDKLVIFGKDSNEEFTTDVNLPNVGGIDSIFAFIYINNRGYYLVDISKKASVRIKIMPETPIKLFNDMILIFAKAHAFVVQISDAVVFGGNQVKILKLKPAQGCKATMNTAEKEISVQDDLIIGRDANCHLSLSHGDISHQHARCYFDKNDGEWKIVDLKSQNGTFYKLKTNTEQNDTIPSKKYELTHGTGFIVESFTFFIRDA